MKLRIIIISIISLFSVTALNAQNLKVDGKKIVNGNGDEVILRGLGLGGWMLQEPYMMEMSDLAANQTQIREKIQELIGSDATQAFYDAWLDNHFTKRDVDSLVSWGFNSIRLPMHYNLFTLPIEDEPITGANTWIDKGFVMVDSLLKWCTDNHIYLILDLHAAPGGQGRDAAISDYNSSKPSLWDNDYNMHKTIALWKKLAERYVNESWIGGYDLINEPNWNFVSGGNENGCSETSNAPLRQLLIDITNAIREVDDKHIIIIEGNCWGNNYNGILPPWDQNMVLSFHKYWSNNDVGTIQSIMDLRNQYNIPIWLGESGENSNTWYTDAIQLVEDNHIGWAWWTIKKIGSINSPYSIVKTVDYQNLLDYWKNGGTAPSANTVTNTLMDIATKAKSENCLYRKDVIDAMFRQVNDSLTLPYSQNKVPGVIYATDFDLGRNGFAYFDTDVANYRVSTGTYTNWNAGWSYRNDGVDIEVSTDPDPLSNHFNVGWIADNEWMQYTIDVDSTAAYAIQLRYAGTSSTAKVKLKCNEAQVSGSTTLSSTGSYQNWSNALVNDVILYKGKNKLKVIFEKSGVNFGFLNISISKGINEVAFKAINAETYLQSETIYLNLNKHISENTLSSSGFSCTVNGLAGSIKSIEINPLNSSQLKIALDQRIFNGDIIKLSYSNGLVESTDGSLLSDFTDIAVTNNLPKYYTIPGKLEAEAFNIINGLVLESTTDAGGGQNIGYTNAGDYLEYLIDVSKTSRYEVEIRVASAGTAGLIKFEQIDFGGNVLNEATVNTPVTGGWQVWTSVSSQINLNEGQSRLKVSILQPEFNLNWYNFTEDLNGFSTPGYHKLSFYPNPANDFITISGIKGVPDRGSIIIRNTNGFVVKHICFENTDSEVKVFVGDLVKGFYILELADGKGFSFNKLIKA